MSLRRRIVIGDSIDGVHLSPVAERPLGGALVKIDAPGSELDRDEVEQLRDALDEVLER